MKKIILSCLVGLFLVGCGPSEAEKLKMKKEKDQQDFMEYIKNKFKDPDSVKFRNIVGDCGELNAKNGFGGYIGFQKFVVKPNGELIVENSDENIAFVPIWNQFCDEVSASSNLESPETTDLSLPVQAKALNLSPKQWDKLTPKQQKFAIEVANEKIKIDFIKKKTSEGMNYERAKLTADAIIQSQGINGLESYSNAK